jgi:tetratricopeptide (TPR) repeat protein
MKETGRLPRAKEFFEKAVVVLDGLSGRFADEARYKQHRARARLNLGTALRAAGEHREARRNYKTAIDILTGLTKSRKEPEYRHELAIAHNNLGNLFEDLKRYDEARAEYGCALDLFAALAKDFPLVPRYRLEQANTHNNLGAALRDANDPEGAWRELGKARALLEALAGEPGAPACRGDLARTHGLLGLVHYDRKQYPEARRQFEEAIRRLGEALGPNPDNPDLLAPLRDNYRRLAETLLQLGEPGPAAEAAAGLAGVFPRNALDSYHAACFLSRCAALKSPPGTRAAGARHAALALKYLRQARDNEFSDRKQFEGHWEEGHFDALEGEEAFRRVVAELGATRPRRKSPRP